MAEESNTRSSLNHSVGKFWELSDAMAREVEVEKRDVTVDDRRKSIRRARLETPRLKQQVQQNVSSNRKDGHFGLRLFDGVPIFNFTWGEDRKSENESFRGNVNR